MTDLHLEIRPLRAPDDYPALSEMMRLLFDWHVTPEQIALENANREARFHHAEFVAEVLHSSVHGGLERRVVGGVEIGHVQHSHEEGKYRVSIMVHPDFQGRGIGGALWETAWNHLQTLDAKKLVNMTDSDSPRGLAMLEHRGFKQVWERIESRLDTRTVDLTVLEGLDARLEAQGIRIVSLAALNDPDQWRKLYDLDHALMLDVPFGQAVTFPSFEQWHKETSSDPQFDPAMVWIAVKEGAWIGFTSLETQPAFFVIGMTGVLPPFRGLGIAKRLKLEGVRYARGHGGLEIRTYNDSVNTAMLEMNWQMGFKRFRSKLRFERVL
jgi:ribosomal protein S18 acetylase RimI-like enzyme